MDRIAGLIKQVRKIIDLEKGKPVTHKVAALLLDQETFADDIEGFELTSKKKQGQKGLIVASEHVGCKIGSIVVLPILPTVTKKTRDGTFQIPILHYDQLMWIEEPNAEEIESILKLLEKRYGWPNTK